MNYLGKWALRLALAAMAASGWHALPAAAADQVRAAKASNVAWSFIELDVGVAEGIFAKQGIELEISALGGDAKLQQALAAGSIDFALGSGPSMAFAAKGAPAKAVAAFAGAPRNISVIVAADSSIKSVADLKGKLLAVTTAGSLTDWLAHRMAITEGWGLDGIKTVALGTFDASTSALVTHQIDGNMGATEAGYLLEEKGVGRVLVGMEKYAPHFITHVVFARNDLIASNPDLVGRFLKGFFGSIAFMKANRDKTIEIAEKVLGQSPAVAGKTYDYEISMLETDGHFDPDAVAVLKDSFVDMHILDTKPGDDQLFTTKFLPVKP
ncbi:MAG TPA: ABC transporter substrate-binding protein [Stellaceae bacterium]|jgi:ABC-type nitrate/sulfonate/bicarbonate transport system substrate-binding protein|nr:ABC transporter substrate-binding protein [Stellaceae bacterium]